MDYSDIIEKDLNAIFPEDSGDIAIEASRYSLLAGGKRIRPKMMFMTYEMLGADDKIYDDVRFYASTLEMIHTSSLIHDDLPCMDNDDLRRGKPTCHKIYGEGIATLAGDLLLTEAMVRLLQISCLKPEYALAGYKMAELTGVRGMIGGQSIDLSSENLQISLDKLYELQAKKTGALIECAIVTPAYLMKDNDPMILPLLQKLAAHIGLAFQIQDDILDVTSDAETLGKSTGKDERDNKSTFVTLLGFDEAVKHLDMEIEGAHKVLDELEGKGCKVDEYRKLVDYLKTRGA